MISYIAPLPIGDAVRVILAPPAGAISWRVLRNTTNVWTDQNDPASGLVYGDGADSFFIDTAGLTNGEVFYYKPFYLAADGVTWSTAPAASATPAATATLIGPDPQSLVRDRLEAALKTAVQAGRLQHVDGFIPCLTAPPTYEGTNFPVVTVHMEIGQPVIQGVGEMITPDYVDPVTGEWTEFEGMIFSVTLKIIAWVVGNGDERIALRREVARALLGNLPVFYAQGLSEVTFSQADIEDLESYNAPVFETVNTMTCFAPLSVDTEYPAISDVTASFT